MYDITLPNHSGLPADYNPEKGLINLAVAEAAEHYFTRAKDATRLHDAIEAKLGDPTRPHRALAGVMAGAFRARQASSTNQMRSEIDFSEP